MTGTEHYAAAERLTALAMDSFTNPEGGYDDEGAVPSAEELATRASILEEARRDAAVYLAAAQVHATLALAAATADVAHSASNDDDNGGAVYQRWRAVGAL